MTRPLHIYLADLTHKTTKATNYTIPLNIGWSAAYLKKNFGNDVEMRLFKCPEKLLSAVRDHPPDVLGVSNYMWNYELNRLVTRITKECSPTTTIISGGPNIRHTPDGSLSFLRDQKKIDIYAKFEGERALEQVVARLLGDHKSLYDRPIPGCVYLREDKLVDGGDLPKTSKIVEYPSPYLSGFLDEFLNDSLIPLFETNRGCPFKCTFCAWGVAALDRVTKFPIDQVIEEMSYVYKLRPDMPLWIFADANFGMLKRDVDIAQEIRTIADKSKSLRQILIWWAKNSGENTKLIAEILGPLSVPYVAMQSLDEDVLKNIRRDNISVSKLLDLMKFYRGRGLNVTTDILLGLPGETRESHYESLRECIDYGFDSVKGANLILLPGTEAEQVEVREKFRIKGMFRLREGSYGWYDGTPVMEFEEIVTETSTMNREEIFEFRMVHWLVVLLWNTGYARPLLSFGKSKGLNPIFVIKSVAEKQGGNYPRIRELFAKFWKDAKSEFFHDKDAAINYYEDKNNFESLLREGFSKLNFKYTAEFILDQRLTHDMFFYIRDLITAKVPLESHECRILDELVECCLKRIFFVKSQDREDYLEVYGSTLAFLDDSANNECRNMEVDVETGHYIYTSEDHHVESNLEAKHRESRTDKRYKIKFSPNQAAQSMINAHLDRLGYSTNPLKALEKALEFMRMMSFIRNYQLVDFEFSRH